MADDPLVRHLAPGRGSRNEATRNHNLSTILALVHHSSGISRAELTRVTGLNRSTIAALVGDLAAGDVVFEDVPATGSVGRPSPIVRPNPRVAVVTVNPDVDAVVVGLVSLGGEVRARKRYAFSDVPTPGEVVAQVADAVAELSAQVAPAVRLVGIGATVPGLARGADGIVARAPHLDWLEAPFARLLEEATGLPTVIDNDATAALIAETIFGVGKGLRDYIYLNGSTSGIGGAVLVGGSVLRGTHGFAGELGHTLVAANGDLCHCGRSGCLETEVNLQRLEDAGGASFDHDDVDAGFDAHSGPQLEAEITRQAQVLSRAIASFVSVFNPEAVVLGGFLGTLFDARRDVVRETVQKLAFAPLADALVIQRASLRENLLVVGAAELAFSRVVAAPLADS